LLRSTLHEYGGSLVTTGAATTGFGAAAMAVAAFAPSFLDRGVDDGLATAGVVVGADGEEAFFNAF